MALVGRRRFPIDRGGQDLLGISSAVPFVKNPDFENYCLPYNLGRNNQSNDGLLTLKYRNSSKDDCVSICGSVDTADEQEIGCGGYGVVWSVRDPRDGDGKRLALKKMANIFSTLGHAKRAYRELRMLCILKHENILTCCDILEPTDGFKNVFVVTELMETDLQRIIVSTQSLTSEHIKIFLYQIFRGMKYLHSANILHRDLKPSNLLVNSNCFLKICDFGLSRIWDAENESGLSLTPEVVTEYYRSPELLMGAARYNASADVWSIGCIFAELLGRRILFAANGPLEQINMIVDLLGTPTRSQTKFACEAARNHVARLPYRQPNLVKFYSLSTRATTDAIDLLVHLLRFDPDERISVEDAIEYPYLQEARFLYHSTMCSCCGSLERALFRNQADVLPLLKHKLEPKFSKPLDMSWERELDKLSMWEIRQRISDFILDRTPFTRPVLALNTQSSSYNKFMASSVVEQLDSMK